MDPPLRGSKASLPPPIDFLIKNLTSGAKEFFTESLCQDFSFCSMLDDGGGLEEREQEELTIGFAEFYRAHGKLSAFLEWSIERDFARGALLQETASKIVTRYITATPSGRGFLTQALMAMIEKLAANPQSDSSDAVARQAFAALDGFLAQISPHQPATPAQCTPEQALASVWGQQVLAGVLSSPHTFGIVVEANADAKRLLALASKAVRRLVLVLGVKARAIQDDSEDAEVQAWVKRAAPRMRDFLQAVADPKAKFAADYGTSVAPLSTDEAYARLLAALTRYGDALDANIPAHSELYGKFFTSLLRHQLRYGDWKRNSNKDGYEIFSKRKDEWSLMKACRTIQHVTVRQVFDFLRDISCFPKTDPSILEARVVQQYHTNRRLLYIRNKVSFPLADRDSVYMEHLSMSATEDEAIIAGHSVETALCPLVKGVDRVFLLNSGFLIEKADGNVRLWYLLHLQPKTPLPQALVKHIIKDAMKAKLNIQAFFTGAGSSHSQKLLNQAEKRAEKLTITEESLKQQDQNKYDGELKSEEIAARMLDGGVSIKDRFRKRELHTSVFTGAAACKWLLQEKLANTEEEALRIGKRMLGDGVFVSTHGSSNFKNDKLAFYRFAVHEESYIERITREQQIEDTIRAVKHNEELLLSIPALEREVDASRLAIERLTGEIQQLRAHSTSPNLSGSRLPQLSLWTLGVAFALLLALSLVRREPWHTLVAVALSVACAVGVPYLLSTAAPSKKAPQQRSHSTLSVEPLELSASPSRTQQQDRAEEAASKPDSEPASPMEPVQGNSKLTPAQRLSAALAAAFPESATVFTESYLASVLNVPERSFQRAEEKLRKALAWRRDFGAGIIQPATLQTQLDAGSLYWYGYDKRGFPILWVKPKLKNYKKLDVKKELEMHVLFLEVAVARMMLPGHNTFVLVADAGGLGLGDFNLQLMRGLLEVLQNNYPDRMEGLYAGPVNMFVRMLYKLLSPAMPARLLAKVHLMPSPNDDLLAILPPHEVPAHFKGPASHPVFTDAGHHFSFDEMCKVQAQKLAALKKEV